MLLSIVYLKVSVIFCVCVVHPFLMKAMIAVDETPFGDSSEGDASSKLLGENENNGRNKHDSQIKSLSITCCMGAVQNWLHQSMNRFFYAYGKMVVR